MTDKKQEQPPAFLRPEAAARYIGVSRRHLTNLTARGAIAVSRIGKRLTLYARADLDAAVARYRRDAI